MMTNRTAAVELENMPGFERAMQRVEAWYHGQIIDRAPVRFSAHNAFVEEAAAAYPSANLQERWFNAEFQVETYLNSIRGRTFLAETFPVYWPNLGPEVYAAFYGAQLEYGEVTAWSKPLINTWDDVGQLRLNLDNPYFKKLEELTRVAFDRCRGRALVGYTDLHPGVDCAAAWRDPQQLCLDLYDHPAQAQRLIELAIADFETIYNHFDQLLKAAGQPSVSWMGIPSVGRMHIPSCDFSALISTRFFEQFCLPVLQREVKTMTHNIFHVDGKNVARHLEAILSVPQVHAIQWVQGMGGDYPILQWLPLIKQIQAKRPVIVDLQPHELEPFIEHMQPEGIFLWMATHSEEQELAIIKRLEKWV